MKFLKRWHKRVKRSKIKPLIKFSNMLCNHQPLILNWFSTGQQHSSGAVEGRNLKAKLALRKAFGFRSYKNYELALCHTLGNLPEPEDALRFCG